MAEKLQSFFTEDAVHARELLIERMKESILLKEEIDPEECTYSVLSSAENGGYKWSYAPHYGTSKKLVDHLASKISDFFPLVERARVRGEVLPLARALEKEFGKGSYRRITTAKTNEAADVIAELKEKNAE